MAKRRLAGGTTVCLHLAAVCLLLSLFAYPQNSPNEAASAQSLLRTVIDGELKAQANDHSHWTYVEKDGADGKEKVKLVVQTRQGDIERLQMVDGHPVTPEEEKQEDQRIAQLLHRPSEQKKRHAAAEKDYRQMEDIFRMIPDAVIASYGERKGDLVEIEFRPNPKFDPPSHEAAVFHEMAGKILVNQKENRLAEIEGHLIEPVRFAGGLLGHLDKGGAFHVKQSEVKPGYWEVTRQYVNMHGRVLFFKTISVQEDQTMGEFQQVPDSLTLAEGAEELQKRSSEKSAAVINPPMKPTR